MRVDCIVSNQGSLSTILSIFVEKLLSNTSYNGFVLTKIRWVIWSTPIFYILWCSLHLLVSEFVLRKFYCWMRTWLMFLLLGLIYFANWSTRLITLLELPMFVLYMHFCWNYWTYQWISWLFHVNLEFADDEESSSLPSTSGSSNEQNYLTQETVMTPTGQLDQSI